MSTQRKPEKLGRRSLGLAAAAWGIAESAAASVPEMARAADDFVDSVGINVHLGSPPYRETFPVVSDRLADLGVRHLRDELRPGNDLERWSALYTRCGIRSHLLVSPATNSVDDMLAYLDRLGAGKVSAIEGQNEGDSPWFRTQPAAVPSWSVAVNRYQEAVFRALRKAHPALPVVSPSVLDYQPADMRLLAPSAAFCDVVALHAYQQHQQEPETDAHYAGLEWYRQQFAAPFKPFAPVMATEAGYHTATGGVSPAAQARYLPRLLLQAFALGFSRTFLYELMDEGTSAADPEQHYGLLRVTGEPKPAYHALRMLLGALADPGPSLAPRPSPVLPLEGPDDLRTVPFARRDGDVLVAIWRAARSWNPDTRTDTPAGPRPLRLRLLRPARDASTLLLQGGEDWTACPLGGDTVALAASDTVRLLRLRF